jgi:hypothetical protein
VEAGRKDFEALLSPVEAEFEALMGHPKTIVFNGNYPFGKQTPGWSVDRFLGKLFAYICCRRIQFECNAPTHSMIAVRPAQAPKNGIDTDADTGSSTSTTTASNNAISSSRNGANGDGSTSSLTGVGSGGSSSSVSPYAERATPLYHKLECPNADMLAFWKPATKADLDYKTPFANAGPEVKYVTFEPGENRYSYSVCCMQVRLQIVTLRLYKRA